MKGYRVTVTHTDGTEDLYIQDPSNYKFIKWVDGEYAGTLTRDEVDAEVVSDGVWTYHEPQGSTDEYWTGNSYDGATFHWVDVETAFQEEYEIVKFHAANIAEAQGLDFINDVTFEVSDFPDTGYTYTGYTVVMSAWIFDGTRGELFEEYYIYHEIAHVINDYRNNSDSHGEGFHAVLEEITKEAIEAGHLPANALKLFEEEEDGYAGEYANPSDNEFISDIQSLVDELSEIATVVESLSNDSYDEFLQMKSDFTGETSKDSLQSLSESIQTEAQTARYWADLLNVTAYNAELLEQSLIIETEVSEIRELADLAETIAIEMEEYSVFADDYADNWVQDAVEVLAHDINISDSIAILRHIVDLEVIEINSGAWHAADVDGSGDIDIGDAIDVLRHIVDLEVIDTYKIIDENGEVLDIDLSDVTSIQQNWEIITIGNVDMSGEFEDVPLAEMDFV